MTATAEQTILFQPAERDCILGDPDEVIKRSWPGALRKRNGGAVELGFIESPLLTELADGLIERMGIRYAALDKIEIAYLWADDLGTQNGDARLIKLKKVDALTLWALNAGSMHPRTPDVLVMLSASVARLAQLTNWQAQAAIHTALECIRVRADGEFKLHPIGSLVTNYIARRYGAWSPDLQAIGAALQKAESEQLPLFEETDEDEEGAGDEE